MAGEKGVALLKFLKETATLRRKRISSYGPDDKVLWLAAVPRERDECRSPFLSDRPEDFSGFWLEARKKPMPTRPEVPEVVADWVRPDDLDDPDREPDLLTEITVITERRVPDPDASEDPARMVVQPVPEVHRLADHPEVEEAWLKYLVEEWEPWAQEMRRWREVQPVYEDLDFMRRRIEEAEERYELVLAVGFLQWRDPTGTEVERHVLTAPAELVLDAARGLLTLVPAASFDGFQIELDMLEPQHQPRLNKAKLEGLLEELDIQAWDSERVLPILHEIANSLRADAQVRETFQRADVEERPCLSFAPAVVLRKRRPTAYEELVGKFLSADTQGPLENTPPWLRLLREGEAPGTDGNDACDRHTPRPAEMPRYLFPLPTNEEQRQIIERLEADPCVLVKGPPGTGKSHTIANLICHLLAKGERVLVTAHAPKALAVLRRLLPPDIRDLCVTALGSSLEDQRLLEENVRGILRRRNEWPGPTVTQQEIERAERNLQRLQDELARVERKLREFREAETHSHELPGGYSGTAAQIAQKLSEEEQEFGWFPAVPHEAEFPLEPSERDFLAEAHTHFTADVRAKLALDIGDVTLPSPDEFQSLVERLTAAEESARRASCGVQAAKLQFLERVETPELRRLREAMRAFTELVLRAGRVLADLSDTILGDLLADAQSRWSSLADYSESLLKDAEALIGAIGPVQIRLPQGIPEHQLRRDIERRLAHFEGGGRKGFWIFAPRVVRETRYLVKLCCVDGKKIRSIEQVRRIRDYLELKRKVAQLTEKWAPLLKNALTITQATSRAAELTAELRCLLAFFNSEQAHLLARILGSKRATLVSADNRDDWLKAIDAVLARRDAHAAQSDLDQLVETARRLQRGSNAHPCLRRLERAARGRDVVAWRRAWQEREELRDAKQRLARYESLLEKLDRSCPGLANLLRTNAGNPGWQDRVCKLQRAWYWASTRAWLRRISDTSAYQQHVEQYHRLKREIEKVTEKLVSHLAWKAFFDRLDERTIQSLNAWTRAVDRIGKGTGKYAYRHRRTARRYLLDCVPHIPAWVMPLHKLWDSVDAIPGLFDTVIIDEASQAGIDALALLLLAKRIVVVGDDRQNSPEAVGVAEDDIARLAREHLKAFRFRDEFRPDTSLFDHAERAFGSHITLREHFRCVPEIIRFSNELCYGDAPLIPLRQAPPERLPPLRSRFVAEGACEGDGQRIVNRAEAEELVKTLVTLVNDKAYEGKTMGVIALQGHAQAQRIETLLAQRLDPKVIEDRRLRCGEPAAFQGDERDVILLSLVVAPNVRYRALTRLPDQRRFNVAMSRARDQVWLFYSVKAHDLAPDDLRRRLISFFESPQEAAVGAIFENLDRLERAAKGLRQRGSQPEPYESWFEVDVAIELLRRKFKVRPQVEVAGYRIDLVVEGLSNRLAVECDGDEWHGPEQYERDMARQRQLERVGWRFVRIRASDFYADRQRAIQSVIEACHDLGIRPADFPGGT